MSYDWKKIKEEIIAETKDVFQHPTNSVRGFDVAEAAELFRKVLLFPISNKPELKLDALPNLLDSLNKILVEEQLNKHIENDDNFRAIANGFEAYLKKILLVISHKVNPENTPNLALAPCIRELGLNSNRINYNDLDLLPNQKTNFGEHLWQAYNIRNEVHYKPPKNRQQFWQGVQSYLVMYLYAAHKHRQAILAAVEPYFLTQYLQNYIADYKQWQTLFVPIAGIEFEKIDLWASEIPEEERREKGEDMPDNEKRKPKQYQPQQPRRSGTIDELRLKVTEKQMVVVAEPGMGKSTSLQYIAYTDALAIENGDTAKPYPVYIELKEFQTGDVIQERVIRKLGIDAGVTKNLLNEGKVTLLLDGLNEVAEAHREEAIKAIQRFMADCPNVFVLITSRPNAYERFYFDKISGRGKAPIFQLQQMELPQIEEFLHKNSGQEAAGMILQAIEANEALKNIIKTPLLLKMLIALVSQQPQAAIPPTETDIILGFISGICDWEVEQNATFNPKTFLERLTYLAHQTRMRNEANTTIAEEEILQILQQKAPEWELKELLKKAVELRLLAHDKTENRYSFAHELYQEALWAKQQVLFDAYPPAANTDVLYTPAIQLWHKPGFKEALRLYSALLQGQQRMDFVREIAKRNVLLAARCKSACWHPEPELRQMIIERAKLFAVFFDSVQEWCAKGFAALLLMEAFEEIVEVLKVYEGEVELNVSSSLNIQGYLRAVGGFRAIVDLYCIVLENTKKQTAKEMLQIVYTDNVTEELVCEQQLQQIANTFKDEKEYENLLLFDANMQTLYLCSPEEVVNIVYNELFLKKEIQSFDKKYLDALLCIIDKYRLPEVLELKDFNSMLSCYLGFGMTKGSFFDRISVNKRDKYALSVLHLFQKYGLPCMLPSHELTYISFPDDSPFEVLPKTELENFVESALIINFDRGARLAAKYNLYNKDFFEEMITNNFLEDDELIYFIAEKYALSVPPPTYDKIESYLNGAEIGKKLDIFDPDAAELAKALGIFELYYVVNGQTRLNIESGGDTLRISESNNFKSAKLFIQTIIDFYLLKHTTDWIIGILHYIEKYKLQDEFSLDILINVYANYTSGYGYITKKDFCNKVEQVYGVILSEEQIDKFKSIPENFKEFMAIEENRINILENRVLPDFIKGALYIDSYDTFVAFRTNPEFKNNYIMYSKLIDLLDLKYKVDVHAILVDLLDLKYKVDVHAILVDLLDLKYKVDVHATTTYNDKNIDFNFLMFTPKDYQDEIREIEIDKVFAKQWLEGLQRDFSNSAFIKNILNTDIFGALKEILKQGLPDSIKIEYVLERAVFGANLSKKMIAMIVQLINQYKVTNRFLILSFCLNLLTNKFSKGTAWFLRKKYDINVKSETLPTVLAAIEKGYIKNVKSWADGINLHDFCPPEAMITKALEVGETETAQYWVQKYNLYHQFPQFEPPGEAAEEDTLPPEEA